MANHTKIRNRSINADLWTKDRHTLQTPIRDFYRGKTILLTGGTGFLGQIWIEKLLRCEVKQIYLIGREKSGKSLAQRLHDMLNGPVFDGVRQQYPECVDRVHIIGGNMRELNLGLIDDDKKVLIDSVEIILHAAADVRFDIPLKELSLVNLRGTRELLRIAEQMPYLQMFAYISTAFSHCEQAVIEEKFYDVPINPDVMIRIAEDVDKNPQKSEMLDALQEIFVHPWPNSYAFTKAVSEELVRSFGNKLPIVIIRPSIVISTHEDPVPGWGNNIYGLNGMLVAAGFGFLRIMFFDPAMRAEVVCADFVTNSTLAAIWDQANKTPSSPPNQPLYSHAKDPRIFMITADDLKLTWGRVSRDMSEQILEYPSIQSMWVPRPSTTQSRILAFFFVLLYHALPGLMFDIYLKLSNDQKRMLPAYRKCLLFMQKLRYFMTQEWVMDKSNMCAVYDRMTDADHKFFPCDIRKFCWEEFRLNYHLGIMQHIGKETLDHFDDSRRRLRWFQIAHFIVLTIYYSTFAVITFYLSRFFGINDWLCDRWSQFFP